MLLQLYIFSKTDILLISNFICFQKLRYIVDFNRCILRAPQISQLIMSCSAMCLLQFRNFKIVYRRYAGLFFCVCVDTTDNSLAYLEAIHNFVEVLNEYFHNVCELDLVFNFYKVRDSRYYLIAVVAGV